MQQEHQKREAERLACDQQKATVMKLIGKLAKPTKTVITDTAISLTIDRNKKLHGQVCAQYMLHKLLGNVLCLALLSPALKLFSVADVMVWFARIAPELR